MNITQLVFIFTVLGTVLAYAIAKYLSGIVKEAVALYMSDPTIENYKWVSQFLDGCAWITDANRSGLKATCLRRLVLSELSKKL